MAPLYFYQFSSFIWPQSPVMPQKWSSTAIKTHYRPRSKDLGSKHQVKSKRPKKWSGAESATVPGGAPAGRAAAGAAPGGRQACHSLMPRCTGLWKSKFCDCTVLNEIKETFFAWTQISWIFKLFSRGCNLQKKKKRIKISHFQQFILFLKINFTSAWFYNGRECNRVVQRHTVLIL